jgi:hypothetical protein
MSFNTWHGIVTGHRRDSPDHTGRLRTVRPFRHGIEGTMTGHPRPQP